MTLGRRAFVLIFPVVLAGYVLAAAASYDKHTASIHGQERARLWQVMNRTWPNFDKYAERTDRLIPVFELTPTG